MARDKHLAALLFSEAVKAKGIEEYKNDINKIAGVISARVSNPKRYGENPLTKDQFSGIDGKEYMKVMTGNLTEEEQGYYNIAVQKAYELENNKVKPSTADHYVTKELYNKTKSNEPWYKQYPIVDESSDHYYMSEKEWRKPKPKKKK